MRILDAILAGKSRMDVPGFKTAIQDMETFEVTNVAEYLYAQTDQEVWDVEHDFPCLAPPFPNFWMEFARPSQLVSEITGVQKTSGLLPHRTALWFEYIDADQMANEAILTADQREAASKQLIDEATLELARNPALRDEIQRLKETNFPFGSPADKAWKTLSPAAHLFASRMLQVRALKADPEALARQVKDLGARWMMKCAIFFQMEPYGPVMGPIGHQTIQIGGDGAPRKDTGLSMFDSRWLPKEAWQTDSHHGPHGLSTLWFSGLLAISFLHCKNVTIARDDSPDPDLSKYQRKRGLAPSRIVFKTLEITPMKKTLERAQTEHAASLQRALHICRGHFANYESRPLFGKYQGRFWIPQHLRGAPQQGLVHKTYNVHPPEKL